MTLQDTLSCRRLVCPEKQLASCPSQVHVKENNRNAANASIRGLSDSCIGKWGKQYGGGDTGVAWISAARGGGAGSGAQGGVDEGFDIDDAISERRKRQRSAERGPRRDCSK